MKKPLLAAALLAAAAIAAPFVASSAPGDPAETQAQATAPQSGAAGAAPLPAEPGGQPMMRRRMMMHRMVEGMSPQQRCIEHVARRAGMRAYLATRLNLTTAQRPLWDKVEQAAQQEEQQERQVCDHMKQGDVQTVLDRLETRQQMLSARLAGLQAAKEPLAALYKVLAPEQRAILDRPFRRP